MGAPGTNAEALYRAFLDTLHEYRRTSDRLVRPDITNADVQQADRARLTFETAQRAYVDAILELRPQKDKRMGVDREYELSVLEADRFRCRAAWVFGLGDLALRGPLHPAVDDYERLESLLHDLKVSQRRMDSFALTR
jgi:hypothetical protein